MKENELKTSRFYFKLEDNLKYHFKRICKIRNETMAEVIRRKIKEYIHENS